MRIKQLIIGVTAAIIAISSYVEIAIADLKFPMLVYRTGAYAPVRYTNIGNLRSATAIST